MLLSNRSAQIYTRRPVSINQTAGVGERSDWRGEGRWEGGEKESEPELSNWTGSWNGFVSSIDPRPNYGLGSIDGRAARTTRRYCFSERPCIHAQAHIICVPICLPAPGVFFTLTLGQTDPQPENGCPNAKRHNRLLVPPPLPPPPRTPRRPHLLHSQTQTWPWEDFSFLKHVLSKKGRTFSNTLRQKRSKIKTSYNIYRWWFGLRCPVDFIFSLEPKFRQQWSAGLDIESTVMQLAGLISLFITKKLCVRYRRARPPVVVECSHESVPLTVLHKTQIRNLKTLTV